jgi:hypothetical protein
MVGNKTPKQLARKRKGRWCPWGDHPCTPACPTDAIDNHGKPFKACPKYRIVEPAVPTPHKSKEP